MPHKYQSISLALFGLGTNIMLIKRLAIWPRFLKPISEVKSEPHVPIALEGTERKNDRWILGTASSENAIFHCENNGQRDHVFKKPSSWSCRKKRLMVFLKDIRNDTYSFVFQAFICFSTKNAFVLGCHGKEVWSFPTDHWSTSSDLVWLHLRHYLSLLSWILMTHLPESYLIKVYNFLFTIPKSELSETKGL